MPGIDPNMPNSKGKTIKDYLPAAMAKLMGSQIYRASLGCLGLHISAMKICFLPTVRM